MTNLLLLTPSGEYPSLKWCLCVNKTSNKSNSQNLTQFPQNSIWITNSRVSRKFRICGLNPRNTRKSSCWFRIGLCRGMWARATTTSRSWCRSMSRALTSLRCAGGRKNLFWSSSNCQCSITSHRAFVKKLATPNAKSTSSELISVYCPSCLSKKSNVNLHL